jgi:hypothetical protein
MEVLLDSNIYLQDVRMAKNPFGELFAYIRRTGSSLLLPGLVREEVLARYSEQLQVASRKASQAYSDLWALTETDEPPFDAPNIADEVQSLEERMRSPAAGITSRVIEGYESVDLMEVARRGIHRKRPASKKGEELRDVMLWLLAINIARHSSSRLAFISGDKDFMADDQQNLHPQLVEDVKSMAAPLDFYPGVLEFVTAHALAHESVDKAWFLPLVPTGKMEELIGQRMLEWSTESGRITGVDKIEIQFEKGDKYTVGDHTYFVEVVFQGTANITESRSWSNEYSHLLTVPAVTGGFSLPMYDTPVVGGALYTGPISTASFGDWSPSGKQAEMLILDPSKPILYEYACKFRATLNARVIGSTLGSIELEGIELESIQRAGSQPGTKRV